MSWRLLEEDGATAAGGLATDEVLAARAGAGTSPPTLRLYTYRPHCGLIGRFQDPASELDLSFCREHDVQVCRRPTGGGAILMGPDQLGIALALPGRGGAALQRARALMQTFSAGIARGLGLLGVEAAFRGKNDLLVGGRKIAGLGVHREASGGLLFHASLLVDLDVPLMARVLRTGVRPAGGLPPEAAEIAALAARTVTVRQCLLRAVSMAEVRAQIAAGFAGAFATGLTRGALDRQEQAAARALAEDRYATQAWLHQRTAVPDAQGKAALRTAAGTVEAVVELAGGTIKAAHLRGDFCEDGAAIAELEAGLRWHPAARERLLATVAAWAGRRPVAAVPPAAFVSVLAAAIAAAGRPAPPVAAPAPRGCFVLPEAGHA